MFYSTVYTFAWILSRTAESLLDLDTICLTCLTSNFYLSTNCICWSISFLSSMVSFFSAFSHSKMNSFKSLLMQSRGLYLSRSSITISFFISLYSRIHSFLSNPSTVCTFLGMSGGRAIFCYVWFGAKPPNAILGAPDSFFFITRSLNLSTGALTKEFCGAWILGLEFCDNYPIGCLLLLDTLLVLDDGLIYRKIAQI